MDKIKLSLSNIGRGFAALEVTSDSGIYHAVSHLDIEDLRALYCNLKHVQNKIEETYAQLLGEII